MASTLLQYTRLPGLILTLCFLGSSAWCAPKAPAKAGISTTAPATTLAKDPRLDITVDLREEKGIRVRDLKHSIFTFYLVGEGTERELFLQTQDTRLPGSLGSTALTDSTFGLPERTMSQMQNMRTRDTAHRAGYDRIQSVTVRPKSSDRQLPGAMPAALLWVLERVGERLDYVVPDPSFSSASLPSRGSSSFFAALRHAQTNDGASLETFLDGVAVATGNTWSLVDDRLIVFSPIGFRAYKTIAPPLPKQGVPAKPAATSRAKTTPSKPKKPRSHRLVPYADMEASVSAPAPSAYESRCCCSPR